MTTFDEDVSSALFDHADRLDAAEGKIWALTRMMRELLSLHDSDVVRSHLQQIREAVTFAGGLEPLLVQGACDALDGLMSDAPPVLPPTPVRPKFALIQGGRTDG
jgi:hypothetical protein